MGREIDDPELDDPTPNPPAAIALDPILHPEADHLIGFAQSAHGYTARPKEVERSRFDNVEMTDAQRARLARLDGPPDRESEREMGFQNEAMPARPDRGRGE